eukprot:3609129-Amphidinium_carterae.2
MRGRADVVVSLASRFAFLLVQLVLCCHLIGQNFMRLFSSQVLRLTFYFSCATAVASYMWSAGTLTG